MATVEHVVSAANASAASPDPLQGAALGAFLGIVFFMFAVSTARGNQEDIEYGLWGDVRRREGGWMLYPLAHWGHAVVVALVLWLLYSMGIDQAYLVGMGFGFLAVNAAGLILFAMHGSPGTSWIYLMFIVVGQIAGAAFSLVVAAISLLVYILGLVI